MSSVSLHVGHQREDGQTRRPRALHVGRFAAGLSSLLLCIRYMDFM